MADKSMRQPRTYVFARIDLSVANLHAMTNEWFSVYVLSMIDMRMTDLCGTLC